MRNRDVAVIGAGPAGIAAAIQLKRSGVTPLVIEGNEVGGLLRSANLVENYPGFPEGIGGKELAERFGAHLASLGLDVRHDEVLRLDRAGPVWELATRDGEERARFVIAATGTKPKQLRDIEMEGDAARRVYYDVVPLANMRGKRIAIIGAGDAAFDYALRLSGHNTVEIVNRGNTFRCLSLLFERCRRSGAVSYLEGTAVNKIVGAEDRVVLHCTAGGGMAESRIDADYVLAAIGREPALGFMGNLSGGETAGLPGNLAGGLTAGLHAGEGLFLAGDVRNGTFRQTAICVGDGVRAAMEVCERLGGDT